MRRRYGIVRPIIRGEILAGDGSWWPAEFLIDTGADRTVFNASTLAALRLQAVATAHRLGGVGGLAAATLVTTQIQFSREEAGKVVFRGQYAAVTDLETLEMSVLGRDIIGLFALIVDRLRGIVCLLRQGHQYTIE